MGMRRGVGSTRPCPHHLPTPPRSDPDATSYFRLRAIMICNVACETLGRQSSPWPPRTSSGSPDIVAALVAGRAGPGSVNARKRRAVVLVTCESGGDRHVRNPGGEETLPAARTGSLTGTGRGAWGGTIWGPHVMRAPARVPRQPPRRVEGGTLTTYEDLYRHVLVVKGSQVQILSSRRAGGRRGVRLQ